MRILELFSGTESFSKVARIRGHEVFTIDNNPKHNPDWCVDIMKVKPKDIIKRFVMESMVTHTSSLQICEGIIQRSIGKR